MTMQPVVTVAIPFYNASSFIEEALDSVLAQTYPNIELLLLDDGSTDNSYDIVQKKLNGHPATRIIRQNNQGEGATRQRLIAENHNLYFFFLDADDLIAPNTIELLMCSALQTDSDMIIGNHYSIRQDNTTKLPRHRIGTQNLTARQLYTHYLRHKVFKSYLWGILYKIKVLQSNVSFPIGKKFIDMAAMPDIIFNCNKITFIDEPLYGYRQNPTGIVRSADSSAHENQMEFLINTGRYIKTGKEQHLYEALITDHLYSMTRNVIRKMKPGLERNRLKLKAGQMLKNIGVLNILKNPEIRLKKKRRITFWYFKDLLGFKKHPNTGEFRTTP